MKIDKAKIGQSVSVVFSHDVPGLKIKDCSATGTLIGIDRIQDQISVNIKDAFPQVRVTTVPSDQVTVLAPAPAPDQPAGCSAKVLYAALCDHAFQDQASKPGMIGIFQHLYWPVEPCTIPNFWVAAQLDFHGSSVDVEVRFVRDDRRWEYQLGRAYIRTESKQSAQVSGGGMILQQQATNLVFPKYGRYDVVISNFGRPIHRVAFEVGPPPPRSEEITHKNAAADG